MRTPRCLVPLCRMSVAVSVPVRSKPLMRGWLHLGAFVAAIPAGIVLLVVAPSTSASIAALVYWVGLLAQFGASAAYHRGRWSDVAYARMRTVDHSAIFLLIAGTYTPFCVVALHGVTAVAVLAIVWAGAAVGIATKFHRVDLHVLSGFLYIGLGWTAVVVLPAMARALSVTGMTLVVTGGVLYTLGAIVLATHRPDPWPRTFGYHEVWHAATIAAAACLYAAVLLLYLSS
jgi:hemolysin III